MFSPEYKKHKEGQSKYRFIYTNINGLNFSSFDGFLKQYDKADLDKAMIAEFEMFNKAESKKVDTFGDYDKYCLDNGIYSDYHHCLIIIDEAYGTFTTTYEAYKNRFLSYHGHFSMDIDFILQSSRQINRRYLDHCEILYVAYPSGKRLFSNVFRYQLYNTAVQKKTNLIETTSIKFSKEVAAYYNSGSNQVYKSFVFKKALPIFILIPILIMLFYFNSSSGVPAPATIEKNLSHADFNQTDFNQTKEFNDAGLNIEKKPNDNTKFFRAFCYSDYCRFEGFNLSLNQFNMLKLLDTYKCTIFITESISVNIIHYYLKCDNSIHDFLDNFTESKTNFKEPVNEKNNFNFNPTVKH